MATNATNASLALIATLMRMMAMICKNFELNVADPNRAVANQEPYFNFRYACAIKCVAKCLMLLTLPQKVACTTSCIMSCRNNHSTSDKFTSCTLDCANSSGKKFFSDAGNKLNLNTYEDVEKLASFVDVCYDKCKKMDD